MLTQLPGQAVQPAFDVGELTEGARQHRLEGGGGRRVPAQALCGSAQNLSPVTDPTCRRHQLADQLLDSGAIQDLHASMLAAGTPIETG